MWKSKLSSQISEIRKRESQVFWIYYSFGNSHGEMGRSIKHICSDWWYLMVFWRLLWMKRIIIWFYCKWSGFISPEHSVYGESNGFAHHTEWFGNGNGRNGSDIMKAEIIWRILNGNMCMFGRTHGKLWRIWDYGHPMEWMIPYDGHGGSCSVWNGTGP